MDNIQLVDLQIISITVSILIIFKHFAFFEIFNFVKLFRRFRKIFFIQIIELLKYPIFSKG